jgi:ferritin
MLTEKMEKALNEQVNAELYSAYMYLSMVSYFQDINLPGFATWMKAQAQEEMFHAMKIYDYIAERGGRVLLAPIAGPPTEWESPVAVMEAVLEHEQKVTGLINGLVDLAIAEKDHASNIFLQWFVSEQVEEEDSVGDVLNKVKLMGGTGGGMFMLDRDLGQRVFTPPQTGE